MLRKYLLLFILSLFGNNIFAQVLLDKWYSKLKVDEKEHHYLIDIRQNDSQYYGYLDIPSSNMFRLPLDSVHVLGNNQIYFSHKGLNLFYNGVLDRKKNEITGTIEKDSTSYVLVFSRKPQVKRSQEVKTPIPYLSKEITFFNRDSIQFSGTMTIPKRGDNFSAVVLITGSGPQNRDEEILGHKPFKILADYLTRQGIVVLRYDDRGYGKSAGQFRPATSLDYTYDALGAVEFLKDYKDFKLDKLGLIGHSEGGNIVPVVATMDSNIDFAILLAAPGISNFESYLISLDLILKEYPETYDRDFPFFKSVYTDMAKIGDKEILKDSLLSKFEYITKLMTEEELSIYSGAKTYINSQVAYHTSDWYHYYLQFDVTPYLEKLKIPILALNGDKDNSIESQVNLKGIDNTLKESGHSNFKTVELKNVNHFFQISKDNKIESVYFNEETFSEEALSIIGAWIKKL